MLKAPTCLEGWRKVVSEDKANTPHEPGESICALCDITES